MDENSVNTNSAGTPRPALCDLCRVSYKDKEPKLLPCLHTFCKACIQTEKSDSGTVKCPTCKQECGSQEIVDDYFMLELVTSGDTPAKEDKEMTCTNCEDNALATSFCLDCTEWLCDACVQAHQRVRVTKDHIVQLRSELQKNDSLPLNLRTLYCQIHRQETLKLFCESCDKLTCRDCQLTDHKEHKYQFVHEASAQHKLFLKTLLQKILEKKTYIEREKNMLNQRFSEITQMQQRVMEDIKTFTLRFVQEINTRGKQLLSDLNLICGNQKAFLGQLNTDLNSLSQKLDHCMKFAEQAIESGSDLALLYSKKIITNQLRNILRSRCGDPDPPNTMDIRFTYETNMSTQYIRKLGSLIVNGRNFRPPGHSESLNEINVPTNSNANNPHPNMSQLPNMDSQVRAQLLGRLQNMYTRPPNANIANSGNNSLYPPRLTHMPDGSPNPRTVSPSNNTIKTSQIFFPPSGVPHNQTGNSAIYNDQNQNSISRPTLIHHHPNAVNRFNHPDKNNMLRLPHPNMQNRMMAPNMNMINFKPGMPTQRLSHYPPNNSGSNIQHSVPQTAPNSQHYSPVISSYYSMARSPRSSVSDRGPTSTTQNRISPAQSPSGMNAVFGRKSVTLRDLLDQNMDHMRSSGDNSVQQCNNYAASSLRELLEQPSAENSRRVVSGNDAFHDLLDQQDGRKTATGDSGSGTASSTDSNKVTSSMPVELSCIKQEKNLSPVDGLICSSIPGIKIKEEKLDDDDLMDQCTKEVLNELCESSAFVSLLEATKRDPSGQAGVFNLGNMLNDSLEGSVVPLISTSSTVNSSMPDHMIRHNISHSIGKGNGPPRVAGLGGAGEIRDGLKIGEGNAEEKEDPSDDYCACCHNGGDLLCCDTCPRVYHLQCHIPSLSIAPSGVWNCGLCKDITNIVNKSETPNNSQTKRKAPSGLTDKELMMCERILLQLFCHESSPPFHEPVSKTVPNYYKIITTPMDMSTVKSKLSRSHFNHYNSVDEFVADIYLIFGNCAKFNTEFSEVGQAGRLVEEFFDELIKKFFPDHVPTNKQQLRDCSSRDSSTPKSDTSENRRKKKKLSCDVVHYC